jgi:uncharacterized protein (TIGR00369 family)
VSGERTRTYSWDDPAPGAREALTMSGLDYLQAIARGDLPRPPIASTLDFALVELEPGRAVFDAVPAEFHYNPIGTVHGGFAATLFDSALGCAIHTRLPAGTAYTTIELKVNYLRPLTVGTVGGRIATAEARLLDEAGRLYGHATTTCLVMRPEGAR